MSSTLFTAPPEWQWLVITYFFVGGLAGGCYFLAALIDLVGSPAERPLARMGYLVAFPLTVLSGILLTLDLTKPLRFWHMLIQSEHGVPMIKWWSPISIGSWALLLFGFFAFLSFLAVIGSRDRSRLALLRPPSPLGIVVAGLGGLFALFIAGYTGVLLSVTNRPIWSDTNLLGLTFVVSAASTSAALLMLLAWRRREPTPGVRVLERFDRWLLVLELIVLVGLVVSLGSLARLWLSAWGALLLVGVVGVGILLPLVLNRRAHRRGWAISPAAATLVLVGGFILRAVIVLSSERV